MHERELMIRNRIAELEDYAQKRACPIYGISRYQGKLSGSGFLLQLGANIILVSAAHVLDAAQQVTLHIPGNGELVPVEGRRYTTCQQDSLGRPHYNVDIAFVVLRPDSVAKIGPESLNAADLDVNDQPAAGTLYGFSGFPASKNKPRPGRTFRRSAVMYTGVPVPDDVYPKLQFDRGTHFAVDFHRERMLTRDLQVTTAPDPHGISGGPVWRLGALSDIEYGAAKPCVIGIAIQWVRQSELLVGVRISLVTEALRGVLGEIVGDFLTCPPFLVQS